MKKIESASGGSNITKDMEKEIEYLTKNGSPKKYSIVRGDDEAELRQVYHNIVSGKISKSDSIKIAIEKKLIEDDDNVTPKKAIEAIKAFISQKSQQTKAAVKPVKTDDIDFSKKEDRLKLAERKKKAQYTNDAYTGNGTQQPSQFNEPLETDAPNPRERYLVPEEQKNVQMKSDITPGEQMEPVPPVASTDADKEIEVLQAKLDAAKKRKVEEEQKKISTLADLLSSLSPESLVALKEKMASTPEKKTEVKKEALDKPHLPDEIVSTPVPEKSDTPAPMMNIVGPGGTSSNPTMSQDLVNSNSSNPTMSQDIAASKKEEKPVKKAKYTPIRNIIAQKECVQEIIDVLEKQKCIEDLMKAEEMLQDGIIPVENIDRAIEVYTTDKDECKVHLERQIELLKDSLKLKAKFISDKDKKSESYWVVKNTKNEPIFKVTASQAFGNQIIENWDTFTDKGYGMKLEIEMKKHGVFGVIEKHYPEVTIFDEGLKNIVASRQKVVSQIPMQTDMGVGESNNEPMDLKEDKPNVVQHTEEIEKEKSAPALVSKEVSDELLAPTEKQPHISDLLVEILSPMILGSEVNTPESIIQDLKSLLADDDSANIFLGKIKQKVYELGNAHEVTEPKKEEKVEEVEMIKNESKKTIAELSSKLKEENKKNAELKRANEELKEIVKKSGIERSARLRAERAKKLSDLRVEIGLEEKNIVTDLMKLSSKEFLDKETETIKVAARLKSTKNNAFVREAGKLWSKGALPMSHIDEEKQPSLIKSDKLNISWSRAVEKKEE